MSDERIAELTYRSDQNQLPYSGTPASYYSWSSAVGTPALDSAFSDNGTAVQVYKFSLSWPALPNTYAPVLVKFRVRDEQLSQQSNWSEPQTIYTDVRYAIYKRRVATTPNEWVLVETTLNAYVGPYVENYAGRVQYAVCIHHANAKMASTEGVLGGGSLGTDVTNRYVLFITDPTSSTMNTKTLIT